jgi:hypothetical protein
MARRALLVISLIAGLIPAGVVEAGPPPLCVFDAGAGRVHVHLPVQASTPLVPVVLARAGDVIVVDGVPCGAATVTATDSIFVDGEDQPEDWGHIFEIDLSGGPFAPGRTNEGDGSSEIEIRVDPGPSVNDDVVIRGGAGPDEVLLRGKAVNLDAAPDDVPDVRLLHMHDSATEDSSLVNYDTLRVFGEQGADRLHMEPRGPNAPFAVGVWGGPGDDRIAAWSRRAYGERGDDVLRNLRYAELFGGPGDDRLIALPWAAFSFSSSYGGGGDDIMVGGPAPDGFAGGGGSDVLWGFDDRDYFNGGPGPDRLDGGSDPDTLYGEEGADHIRGGRGRDKLYGGAGRNRCDDDPSDPVVRDCGARALLG